jgi:hypothetical protein
MIRFKMDGCNISVVLGDIPDVTVIDEYGNDRSDEICNRDWDCYVREAIAIFNAEKAEHIAERLM